MIFVNYSEEIRWRSCRKYSVSRFNNSFLYGAFYASDLPISLSFIFICVMRLVRWAFMSITRSKYEFILSGYPFCIDVGNQIPIFPSASCTVISVNLLCNYCVHCSNSNNYTFYYSFLSCRIAAVRCFRANLLVLLVSLASTSCCIRFPSVFVYKATPSTFEFYNVSSLIFCIASYVVLK